MNKTLFIFILIFYTMPTFTHSGTLEINHDMVAALKKSNPRFVTWNTQDYTPTIQKDASKNKRQPYSLTFDFNSDGKSDLILDGHDDHNDILLCLLSNAKGYDVIVVRKSDRSHPQQLENFDNGKKEIGLNYYLWALKNGSGFTVAYPQQSDSEGKLLNDGAMIDYVFKNGEFIESYQTL